MSNYPGYSIICGNFRDNGRGHLQKSSCPFKTVTSGEMAEWLKAHAWKACVRETVPWVRIPLSPPPIFGARFLHRWMGRKSPVNWGISIAATVLEIDELRHFSLGDGIFLRSFVLCGFSIVSKSEVPEGQLETKFAPGSNPVWMSERN